jgi:hypothetical protein
MASVRNARVQVAGLGAPWVDLVAALSRSTRLDVCLEHATVRARDRPARWVFPQPRPQWRQPPPEAPSAAAAAASAAAALASAAGGPLAAGGGGGGSGRAAADAWPGEPKSKGGRGKRAAAAAAAGDEAGTDGEDDDAGRESDDAVKGQPTKKKTDAPRTPHPFTFTPPTNPRAL